MLTVWLIPVAYVAGIEGFGWFVPYLLFVCAIATIRRMQRRARSVRGAERLASEPAKRVGDFVLEFEPASA
jgi:hypothetical protein